MADNTLIEWADATWNPVTGCAVVSPGCTNCYAMRLAGTRLKHHPSRQGLTRNTAAGPVWNGAVRLNEAWLDQPLRWQRPRRIFVCAHGDLFAETVPDDWIDRVFAVMAMAPQHTFLVLTKRAKRMRKYVSEAAGRATEAAFALTRNFLVSRDEFLDNWEDEPVRLKWPLPNVWLGTSAEDQTRADERIRELLATPAAKYFVSLEPLLGPIDLPRIRIQLAGQTLWRRSALYARDPLDKGSEEYALDWVIVGGESGPGARPMHPDWARSLRDQCQAAGVPFFFKQWGEWIDADQRVSNLKRAGAIVEFADGRPLSRPLNFDDAALVASIGDTEWMYTSDGLTLIRVGKKVAGRHLDGQSWSELPE